MLKYVQKHLDIVILGKLIIDLVSSRLGYVRFEASKKRISKKKRKEKKKDRYLNRTVLNLHDPSEITFIVNIQVHIMKYECLQSIDYKHIQLFTVYLLFSNICGSNTTTHRKHEHLLVVSYCYLIIHFYFRDALRGGCSEEDLVTMIEAAVKRKKKQHAGEIGYSILSCS